MAYVRVHPVPELVGERPALFETFGRVHLATVGQHGRFDRHPQVLGLGRRRSQGEPQGISAIKLDDVDGVDAVAE